MRSLSKPTARRALVAALLTGALVGLAACGGSSSGDNVATLPADDPSISAARQQSQSHWSQFVASFEEEPGLTYSVKVSLQAKDDSASELIWVHVTAIDGNTVIGTLDNDPVSDLGLKFGDEVSLQRSQVEDWAVFDDGKVVLGGYSIEPDAAAATTTTG
jgi:uncharacterized protein YegJ (DUF2314 family)